MENANVLLLIPVLLIIYYSYLKKPRREMFFMAFLICCAVLLPLYIQVMKNLGYYIVGYVFTIVLTYFVAVRGMRSRALMQGERGGIKYFVVRSGRFFGSSNPFTKEINISESIVGDDESFASVLEHEVGHIKNRDLSILTFLALLMLASVFSFGILFELMNGRFDADIVLKFYVALFSTSVVSWINEHEADRAVKDKERFKRFIRKHVPTADGKFKAKHFLMIFLQTFHPKGITQPHPDFRMIVLSSC